MPESLLAVARGRAAESRVRVSILVGMSVLWVIGTFFSRDLHVALGAPLLFGWSFHAADCPRASWGCIFAGLIFSVLSITGAVAFSQVRG